MEDYLDVLDPSGTPAGFARPRSQVHREGLWHRSTHVWVFARQSRQILLQRRSAAKDTYPGCWDVSAAGHVCSGEESSVAALRELAEELGLADGIVHYLFTARSEAQGKTDRYGTFHDREFQDVYVYLPDDGEDVPLSSLRLQKTEVDAVEYWDCAKFLDAVNRKDPELVPRSQDYMQQFLPYLRKYLA